MATTSTTTPAVSEGAGRDLWPHRCLLGLEGLEADALRTVLQTARGFAEVSTRSVKKVPSLRGKVVANLFFEESTRTRLSFTLAAQRLSADVIDLSGSGSSVAKGETVVDTALNVEAMGVDAMVVRHKASGAPHRISEHVRCAVVNAGDGKHEHPTQGLLDIYTLARAHGRLETFDLSGLRVAVVGDIVSSRVARSNIFGLLALGASVVCVGPPTLAPRSLEALGCTVEHDFDRLIDGGGLSAVNMLRIQFERHSGEGGGAAGGVGVGGGGAGAVGANTTGNKAGSSSPAFPSIREYAQCYGLTAERASRLPVGAVVMHPGPMNRGVEIADDVADGPRSVILEQVANGLAVRMAVLFLCVAAAEC
ncbi:MAG: aspartate carbamoyltransferase catalytic subunit [Phycisphaeraceae bacterium]|nr:aspartate carbamoyltransferase catalytic subunit [Phycisphaeraceae bacterium]